MNNYTNILHTIESENIDINDIQSLNLLAKCGNISIEDLQSEIEYLKNEKYLENHSNEITQGNDGRWRTYLPVPTQKSGRKLVAKNTREGIEQGIIKFYKDLEEDIASQKNTLRSFYHTWIKYKTLQTRSSMYIMRISSDWNKYYLNDKLIDIPLKKLDFDTLQEWALRKVRGGDLTKKQYYNMTVIIRQSLDYAVQKK